METHLRVVQVTSRKQTRQRLLIQYLSHAPDFNYSGISSLHYFLLGNVSRLICALLMSHERHPAHIYTLYECVLTGEIWLPGCWFEL